MLRVLQRSAGVLMKFVTAMPDLITSGNNLEGTLFVFSALSMFYDDEPRSSLIPQASQQQLSGSSFTGANYLSAACRSIQWTTLSLYDCRHLGR